MSLLFLLFSYCKNWRHSWYRMCWMNIMQLRFEDASLKENIDEVFILLTIFIITVSVKSDGSVAVFTLLLWERAKHNTYLKFWYDLSKKSKKQHSFPRCHSITYRPRMILFKFDFPTTTDAMQYYVYHYQIILNIQKK